MPAGGIRTHNLSGRAAADPRLWYRCPSAYYSLNTCILTAQCLTSFQIRTCFSCSYPKPVECHGYPLFYCFQFSSKFFGPHQTLSQEKLCFPFSSFHAFFCLYKHYFPPRCRDKYDRRTRKDRRDSYSDRLQRARKQHAAYTCGETNPVQDTSLDSKSLTHSLTC
jgi:hypothetical protein